MTESASTSPQDDDASEQSFDVHRPASEDSMKFEGVVEAEESATAQSLFPDEPLFSDRFLREHAGQIMSEPRIAILELVANAYDAGATLIDIRWPDDRGGEYAICDNGIGMTEEELRQRWRSLSYDRTKTQGVRVLFPTGTRKTIRRKALGQHGKGRHAPFCFNDTYTVQTTRAETSNEKTAGDKQPKRIRVEVSVGSDGKRPFSFGAIEREPAEKGPRGTTVSGVVNRHFLPVDEIRELIGSKFLVDPSFEIRVNGRRVDLLKLEGIERCKLSLSDGSEVEVLRIDSMDTTRTADLRGITWWANGRMVGTHSWQRLNGEGVYLDGRTQLAKKLSFVVLADCLKKFVKPDWTGFQGNAPSIEAEQVVHDFVQRELNNSLGEVRKSRKEAAVREHDETIRNLPRLARKVIDQFIDEVQEQCPTLSESDLKRTVGILSNLEQSRSGFDLLVRLSDCSSDDLDTWNDLMSRWTANGAAVVLNELDRRLQLIARMESLVESPLADELHDLQPLFERGLWIFGPEYESVEFQSNRTLATAVRDFLGPSDSKPEKPSDRPDFIVTPNGSLTTPDGSIGFYGAANYDQSGEVDGLARLLVLELKKGGFAVTRGEMQQALDYCADLQNAGRITEATSVTAYVMGATTEGRVRNLTEGGNIEVKPLVYESVLMRAKTRTFNLQKKLRDAGVVQRPQLEIDQLIDSEPWLRGFEQ